MTETPEPKPPIEVVLDADLYRRVGPPFPRGATVTLPAEQAEDLLEIKHAHRPDASTKADPPAADAAPAA